LNIRKKQEFKVGRISNKRDEHNKEVGRSLDIHGGVQKRSPQFGGEGNRRLYHSTRI